jgi:hypothetical protein
MNSGSCVSVVEPRGSNPDPTRQNTALSPCSLRLVPVQSRSLPAVSFSSLDDVKSGHCTATMVVTNRHFTPAAQKLAGIHGVELVDRVRLERLAISSPVSTT